MIYGAVFKLKHNVHGLFTGIEEEKLGLLEESGDTL